MVAGILDEGESSRSDLIDYASLTTIVALMVLIVLGIEGPVRAFLALGFVMFVPGWAIVTNWTAAARSSIVALSVLLSLAISAAVATITVWLHVWHPIGLFFVTAIASALAIVYGHVRRRSARDRS